MIKSVGVTVLGGFPKAFCKSTEIYMIYKIMKKYQKNYEKCGCGSSGRFKVVRVGVANG